MTDITKAVKFNLKRLHHNYFFYNFTNLLRVAVDLLLTSLLLTSRLGESERDLMEKQDLLPSLQMQA